MAETVLSLRSLNRENLINDVCLTINKGEIHGIAGSEKSGKTTLLRLICGIIYPDSGEIELFGESSQSGLRAARRKTGSIIDSPTLFENMTIRHNLLIQSRNLGIKGKSRIKELQETMNLDQHRYGRQKATHLTIAERARCALAMSFLGMPELLILDEPFKFLDPASAEELLGYLTQYLKETGASALITCIKPDELPDYVTIFHLLEKGTLSGPFDRKAIKSAIYEKGETK